MDHCCSLTVQRINENHLTVFCSDMLDYLKLLRELRQLKEKIYILVISRICSFSTLIKMFVETLDVYKRVSPFKNIYLYQKSEICILILVILSSGICAPYNKRLKLILKPMKLKLKKNFFKQCKLN